MLILAVESSAGPASVAVVKDNLLLAETFQNAQSTHSQTLLPMVKRLMNDLSITADDLDLLAVSNGPGSFTGVRIGVACVKGIALPNHIPCCGVSTLEAIAMGGRICPGSVVCAVMDARRGQVYNALFSIERPGLSRLTPDRAISVADLKKECLQFGNRLLLIGDGAALCYESFLDFGARLAPPESRFQRASWVALVAERQANREGGTVSPQELLPSYLRLPQAERELNKHRREREE